MQQIWLGLVEVRPLPGCELLTEGAKGAFVQMLTWASSAVEFETKVAAALSHYDLFAVASENVHPVDAAKNFDDEVLQDAFERIQTNRDWTLFSTFHNYLQDEA